MFLFFYEEHGNIVQACDACNISYSTLLTHCTPSHNMYDPEFVEAYEESKLRFKEAIMREGLKRATVGWEEPIIGGKDRDQIVAYKPVKSDRLLELFLKKVDPELREGNSFKLDKSVTNIHTINQHVNLDIAKLSPEERLKLRELLELRKVQVAQKLIAGAPTESPAEEITDAEFEVIEEIIDV